MRIFLTLIPALALAIFSLGGCASPAGNSTSTAAPPPPAALAPTVSSTVPANVATNVFLNTGLSALFSEAMDSATVTTASFSLSQGITVVPGTVGYSGSTATFQPTNSLAPSTLYTATLTTGLKASGGLALVTAKTWTFTTGVLFDNSPPTVSSTAPGNAAVNVALNSSPSAVFNKAMDPSTITAATFSLNQGALSISGTVSYAGTTATFHPASALASNTTYTATITTGVKASGGVTMAAAKTWTFTTGAPPTVISVLPSNLALGIDTATANLSATFSESVDAATVTTSSFTVDNGAPVAGSVTYSGNTAVFTPSAGLLFHTRYTATISTMVKDLAGNPMAADKVWSFTTALAPVALNSAGNYEILSKAGISTTGATTISGDIGVSPASVTAVTGFTTTGHGSYYTASEVTNGGRIYAAGMAPPTPASLTAAIGDMESAYTVAAGIPTPDFSDLATGNLGGLTLVPGLYRWNSVVTIPSSLVLNGDSNAVWILQITGTLTSSSATRVTLTGGAQAKNVFWQVAGAVEMGTTSHFEGVLLAQTAVTMLTGATMTGQVFAQTAVALQAVTLTAP